jgi:hypothetical protein
MKAVYSLMERLTAYNTLIVQNEEGYIAEAGFEWKKPASDKEIQQFEVENDIKLPKNFIEFLKISNGATIFKDIKCGQWGCNILGLHELISLTCEVKKRGYNLSDKWLVFATWLGDGDMLVFDLEKYNTGERNYIIDGDQGYQADDWEYINGDFSKWIDRLIVSQGAKYWRWS